MRPWWIDSILCAALSSIAPSGGAAPGGDGYCAWEVQDFAIDQPLCGLRGDPARGRALLALALGPVIERSSSEIFR